MYTNINSDPRVLHRLTPLLHNRGPPGLDVLRLRYDVGSVQARELSLVWRLFAHLPEEPAFGIGMVPMDIERALRGR